jgi:hypothetical protein
MNRGPRLLIAASAALLIGAVVLVLLTRRYPARKEGVPPTRPLKAQQVVILGRATYVVRDDGSVWRFGLVSAPSKPTEGLAQYAPYDSHPLIDLSGIGRIVGWTAVRRRGGGWSLFNEPPAPMEVDAGLIDTTRDCDAFADGRVLCMGGGESRNREQASLRGARKIAAGQAIVCGLVERKLRCVRWTEDGYQPAGSIDEADIVDFDSAGEHLCTVHADGALHCWSWSKGAYSKDAPTPDLPRATHIVMSYGAATRCIRAEDGHAYCWGKNDHGQVGDGGTNDRDKPTRVVGLPPIVSIAMGTYHACALATDEQVWCWGDGTGGQLGDGKRADRQTAVRALW